MRLSFAAILLLAFAVQAGAQNATTALSALRLLPKNDSKRLARIEAREGKLTPERWYFVIHDPADENGLREFVVSGGEVVANRTLSQFAENVKAEEVIDVGGVKVDSDQVAQAAQLFAQANNQTIGSLSYRLNKEGDNQTLAWTVTCLDRQGKRLGEVVVGADKGDVLSHPGFNVQPPPERLRPIASNEEAEEAERVAAAAAAAAAREKAREEQIARQRAVPTVRPRTAVVKATPTPEPKKPFWGIFGGGKPKATPTPVPRRGAR